MEQLAIIANLRMKDHPPELEKKEVEKWLKVFVKKIKRKTTRTKKCRLVAAVERNTFREDWNAWRWQYCQFDGDKGTIFDRHQDEMEEFELNETQKEIIFSEPTFLKKKISRWEIKEEKENWELTDEIKKKIISEGGEALVFSEQFGNIETAIRVQVFDPFLFTDQFGYDEIDFEINLSKG